MSHLDQDQVHESAVVAVESDSVSSPNSINSQYHTTPHSSKSSPSPTPTPTPPRPVLYQSPFYTTPATSIIDKTQYFDTFPTRNIARTMSPTQEQGQGGSSSSSSQSSSGSRSNSLTERREEEEEEKEEQGQQLNIPHRPSLNQTESTQPLMAPPESPLSPMSEFTTNPFPSNGLSIPTALGADADVDFDGRPLGTSSISGQSMTGFSPTMPRIRVNYPDPDQGFQTTEDASDVPSALPTFNHPTYGGGSSLGSPGGRAGGGSFSSPFSNPLRLRASNSSMTSPTQPMRGSVARASGTDFPGAGAGSPTASRRVSSFDANSITGTIPAVAYTPNPTPLVTVTEGPGGTKASIAARRALRAKQAQSLDSKGNRNSHLPQKKNASLNRKPFQSTRLKGEIYKPWLEQKDPALRWARWITIASIVLGVAIAGFICYTGYSAVPSLGKVCSVLDDDFSSGTIDSSIWQHEVRLDGYGYGSFQWTTDSSNNSFVQDGTLYIVPTLTSDHLGVDAITNGYTLNLTADGTCTSTNVSQCVAVSNSSLLSVINPVMSARLITKDTVNIKYGKVEVKAKFPSGDWLWPRISMLPANNSYGVWPRSGQIDLLQGRGNNASYTQRGVDYAQSDLHWGPTTDLDRLYLTWGYREQRRTYYSQKFHTFGLEWNEDFMWTYIDSRVAQVISLRFGKQSFWSRGVFPTTYTNKTTGDIVKLTNPWISSENNVAPFDQQFYLAIDLGVGSLDGWFPDGEGGKPWLDDSLSAMSDFWAAKSKWWDQSWSSDPTKRGFAIDSVKVWKTC